MAFPSSPCGAVPQPPAGPGFSQPRRAAVPSAAVPSAPAAEGASEGDHQLEKLEFALAVALTRGDVLRSEQLRHQIDALGGNQEEPGT